MTAQTETGTSAARGTSLGEGEVGVYLASKTAHAPRWRQLRADGYPVISTWIDEAGVGETASFADLWRRCVAEASQARAVLVYREPGETLKGAFVEVGAALAVGRPVFAVGCDEFSFVHHAKVTRCADLEDALLLAAMAPLAATPAPQAVGVPEEVRRRLKPFGEIAECLTGPDETNVCVRQATSGLTFLDVLSIGDFRYVRTLLSAQPAKPTGEDAGARALAEIAYWRRDLAARLLFARAQHGPAMREGRYGEAFLHEQVMRGGIAALTDADEGRWYEPCEFCGEQIRPGEATASDEENGGTAHARCAVENPPPDGPPDDEAADLARQVELAREALAVEYPEVATPAPAPIPADEVREAAQALLDACAEDMGYGDETGDHPDRDEDAVGGGINGPMAVQFGHLRRLRNALARPSAPGEGLPHIADPDYARVFTKARCLAWQGGYALLVHGTATRDLDLLAVPWADRVCEPEHLIQRIVAATGLKSATDEPGTKPHGRLVWTLLFPEFGDPRFVDLSVIPRADAALSRPDTAGEGRRPTADDLARWLADHAMLDPTPAEFAARALLERDDSPLRASPSPDTAGDGEGLDLRSLHAANIARQAEWCSDQVPDLSFRGNELAGETGEACNVIKKLERERHGWRGSRASLDDLAQELADVVICADLCAVTAGIDLSAAVTAKFNATSEKQGLSTLLRAPSFHGEG